MAKATHIIDVALTTFKANFSLQQTWLSSMINVAIQYSQLVIFNTPDKYHSLLIVESTYPKIYN